MPTIHISIDDEPVSPVDHDYCAAVNLAQAAQHLRLALEHADDDEISKITVVAERLTAEYLATSG